MSAKTKIEWVRQNSESPAGETWNPQAGCSKVSAGCSHCYAINEAARMQANPNPKIRRKFSPTVTKQSGRWNWTGEITFSEETLLKPLRTKKPTVYFVNSLSDLFHENVPDEWIDRIFAVIALSPQHTFQVLTKRAERMHDYFNGEPFPFLDSLEKWWDESPEFARGVQGWAAGYGGDILNNCWLGVSVEDQKAANERIPFLLDTPAVVRWLSCEPLLGEINLTRIPTGHWAYGKVDVMSGYLCGDEPDEMFDWDADPNGWIQKPAGQWSRGKHRIDWVIVGGESGNNARPCSIHWIRKIIKQCKDANVPCFVKQLGAKPIWGRSDVPLVELKLKNKKGGDMTEWTEDLRVRQFPRVTAGGIEVIQNPTASQIEEFFTG